LELEDDSFYNIIIMHSPFLMGCFMDDNSNIVNQKLCLYRMPFLLFRIVCLPFSFILRPWYLVMFYIQSMKAIKPRKYCSTSSVVVEASLLLFCKTSAVLAISTVFANFQSFDCLYANVTLVQVKQKTASK